MKNLTLQVDSCVSNDNGVEADDSQMPSLKLEAKPLEDALFIPRIDYTEISDRIKVMLNQEETTYVCKDYVGDKRRGRVAKTGRKQVDEECRFKICTWCYKVADYCNFRREIVAISMSLLDRFLCTEQGRDVLKNLKEYQLFAMTSLYMAMKLNEPLPMDLSQFVDLAKGCYVAKEIIATETRILTALDWKIQNATAIVFCVHFLLLLPDSVHPAVSEAILDYAKYQTELAIFNCKLLTHKVSHVALAAILNALKGISSKMLNENEKRGLLLQIEKVSGIQMEDVEKTREILDDIMLEIYAQEVPVMEEQHACVPYNYFSASSDEEKETSSLKLSRMRLDSPLLKSPDCATKLSEYL